MSSNFALKAAKISPWILLIVAGLLVLYFQFPLGIFQLSIVLMIIFTSLGFMLIVAGIVALFYDLKMKDTRDKGLLEQRSSDVVYAVKLLSKNYDVLRKQATLGFILSSVFLSLGIIIILMGAVGEILGFTKSAGNLSTIAGVVIELISGVGMYLFRETFRRINQTSDNLQGMWRILAGFKEATKLPENSKSEVIANLIYKLADVKKEAQTP